MQCLELPSTQPLLFLWRDVLDQANPAILFEDTLYFAHTGYLYVDWLASLLNSSTNNDSYNSILITNAVENEATENKNSMKTE